MKKIYLCLMLPFIFLIVYSCSVDALRENVHIEGQYGYDFRESKAEWDKLKKKNGNSYEYTILEHSWIGIGSETTITIQNGKVTARYYEAFEIVEEGDRVILYSYFEKGKGELGSHPEGAAPVTMDELYRSCISQYLIADSQSNDVYFETDEHGVMVLCGFVPFNCQDDCYRGIKISHFSWI